MKKRSAIPNILVIVGLVVLLAVLSIYHMDKVNRLSDEVQFLRTELEQVNTTLSQTSGDLSQEREKTVAARVLRNFSSLDELHAFLHNDRTNKHEYIEDTFDCDDFALILQRRALEEGYLMNCQKMPIQNIEHMMNMVIIGNEIYYIEASTDRVTYAGYID